MLASAFKWAREVNVLQPIISAVWDGSFDNPYSWGPLNEIMLKESDIIVFHNYDELKEFKATYKSLLKLGRPVICNEWMSRPSGSTFASIMPYMKENKIGAYNWGFVSGKTQTIYPWDSWVVNYNDEPKVWFHDILRQDGTPFDEEEIKIIKSLTFS